MNNRIGDNLLCTGSNRKIVAAFSLYKVEFVVIGGLAVAWYCPQRHADDMDLLLNPTMDNSRKVSGALGSLKLQGFNRDSFAKSGLQVRLKEIFYAELLTPQANGPNFSSIANNAIAAKLFDFPVLIASPASLIELKELALSVGNDNSHKHLADIEALRVL